MYQKMIADLLAAQDVRGIDPRHVEAYMRLEHGTLDNLATLEFGCAMWVACATAEEEGPSVAEAVAQSYGL